MRIGLKCNISKFTIVCIELYCSVFLCVRFYDVNEREKNEENKVKKHLVALTGCISFTRKTEKFLVLQQECSFSLCQQLCGNHFGNRRQ
jgi:hypothetical protein